MKRLPFLLMALALLGVAAFPTTIAVAGNTTTKVTVGNNFFGPESKTIKKGTKVKFNWTGGGAPHDVTKKKGPGGQFQSDLTSEAGVNFKKTFKKTGTYRIFCTIHESSMKLKLTVRKR